MILSNPSKSGFQEEVESLDQAKEVAVAVWFRCDKSDVVAVQSPDGGTTYLYESQEQADADQDGAYAVQVRV